MQIMIGKTNIRKKCRREKCRQYLHLICWCQPTHLAFCVKLMTFSVKLWSELLDIDTVSLTCVWNAIPLFVIKKSPVWQGTEL